MLPSPCARSRFLAACVLPLPAAAFLAACVLPLPAAALFHVYCCVFLFTSYAEAQTEIELRGNAGTKAPTAHFGGCDYL